MTKEKELFIGDGYDNLSEHEEIEILKLKNGTRSLSGKTSYADLYQGSFTSGIGKSIWDNRNLDWIFIRDRIKTYFINLFEWEGEDVSPEFKRELELILFRHGRAVVFKTPDGEFYPAQYTWTKDDEDFYGNPKQVSLVTTNDFNGNLLKEGEFVYVFNNTSQYGTLDFANERLRQTVRALKDIDNASILSRPKWSANITDDDASLYDIENAMNSDKWIIPMGNIDFRDADIQDLSGEDRTETRINGYSFQLSNLLKLLGLKVNDGNIKAERQTELEISRNDEFDSLLIGDMFERRKEAIDKLKEFGMSIELAEPEALEENEDKDNVNGMLNKAIERGEDNEE